jgi:hypothetical protein
MRTETGLGAHVELADRMGATQSVISRLGAAICRLRKTTHPRAITAA